MAEASQSVSSSPASGSRLLRSNLVVAIGTALSRLTGLIRIAVFVYVIGRTALADAYQIANETPNIVFDLLLGGLLAATLVPLFTSFLHDGDDEATNVVITVAMTLVTALTVAAVIAAPLVFGIYTITPSGDVDPEILRSVGTTLTRIFLIQILFYGLTAVANALLNARRRFFAAAWSPILANLVIIATLLSLPGAGSTEWALDDVVDDRRLRLTLGLGATLGIATMALVLIPAVIRSGVRYRPVWNWRHPAVAKLLRLSGWTLGFVAANQIALVVIRNLAEPGSGDAAAYVFAFTFFVLPHGLLAVSVSTTFQPELARAVASDDEASFVHHTALGIRIVALLTVPAAVLILVLRQPIIGAAFQRGAFGADDAFLTAQTLGGFALGLVGFSVYMFTLRGFYARQNTRTPFWINVMKNLINIALALVLVRSFGVVGLAVALAVAYLVSAIAIIVALQRRTPTLPVSSIMRAITAMAGAGALMGLVTWLVSGLFDATTGSGAVIRIAVASIAGLVVYAASLAAMRSPEARWVATRLGAR